MREFHQVDVFSEVPFQGNPVAVVLDGDGLSTEQMQRFARWTNLSETTFVLSPTTTDADYRVRIFTPATELPFAGHPTLGTCHAWASGAQQQDTIVQECGAGLVTVRRSGELLAFAAPPLRRSGPVEEPLVEQVASVLGIERAEIVDARWADNGPGWIAVLLADAESVLALRPDRAEPPELAIGVVGPYPPGSPADFEVRAFFPDAGTIFEDPVTGSFNASAAEWLLRTGRASAPYVAAQGTAIDRRGRVHVWVEEAGTVWVGGAAVSRIHGHVEL